MLLLACCPASPIHCTASTQYCSLHSLYCLVVRPVLDFQPPLSTSCIACLLYSLVQHHTPAAILFSLQPLVSAALLHLLANWPLQLCRCWPAATACGPAPGQPPLFADKPPGQPLLLADQPLASRYCSLTSPWPAATAR